MNAVLLVAGWCETMVASGTPAQTARQQLRAQQPVDVLTTLRQAGLGTPAYRADGSTGMLAVAAQQAGIRAGVAGTPRVEKGRLTQARCVACGGSTCCGQLCGAVCGAGAFAWRM